MVSALSRASSWSSMFLQACLVERIALFVKVFHSSDVQPGLLLTLAICCY